MSELNYSFNTVFVIESLRPGDKRTGKLLYEEVLKPAVEGGAAATASPVEVSYVWASTAEEFLGVLRDVAKKCSEEQRKPVLHLETHGWDEGICFADDSEIMWAEILSVIQEVNRASGLNTLVFVAACEGANFLATVQPAGGVASAYALIGPLNKITDTRLERDCQKFYRELLSSRSLPDALALLGQEGKYAYVTALWWFKNVVYQLLNGTTPEQLRERREAIMKQTGIPNTAIGVVEEIDSLLENPEPILRAFHRSFFMVDDVFENGERFAVDYAELANGAPPSPPSLGPYAQNCR